MTKKVALITGVTGQDGAYLSELLLSKGYEVHGIKRRSSLFNTDRVNHLYQDPHEKDVRFKLHYGDLTDSNCITRIVQEVQPDEIYNLGAMSHVQVSFEIPEYTADADGIGALRILEAVRLLGLKDKTKIYQASTSELFGRTKESPQNEDTPFHPRSPYGVAKLYAHWITINYREAHGLFACNGILYNHESPLRGETFVTRKITRAVASIVNGKQESLFLGNLNAKRDWGHAKDFVRAMWLMLQQDIPEDFVVSTGVSTTVREFASLAFAEVGIRLEFRGEGENEVGVVVHNEKNLTNVKVGHELIKIDPSYFRPAEVDTLIGDASNARKKLGWSHTTSLKELVVEMVAKDLQNQEMTTHLSMNTPD